METTCRKCDQSNTKSPSKGYLTGLTWNWNFFFFFYKMPMTEPHIQRRVSIMLAQVNKWAIIVQSLVFTTHECRCHFLSSRQLVQLPQRRAPSKQCIVGTCKGISDKADNIHKQTYLYLKCHLYGRWYLHLLTLNQLQWFLSWSILICWLIRLGNTTLSLDSCDLQTVFTGPVITLEPGDVSEMISMVLRLRSLIMRQQICMNVLYCINSQGDVKLLMSQWYTDLLAFRVRCSWWTAEKSLVHTQILAHGLSTTPLIMMLSSRLD